MQVPATLHELAIARANALRREAVDRALAGLVRGVFGPLGWLRRRLAAAWPEAAAQRQLEA